MNKTLKAINEGFDKRYLNESSVKDRIKIAKDPSTSIDALYKLAQSKNDNIRAAVAENPNTPDDLLFDLTYEDAAIVRSAVLHRPDLHTKKNLLTRFLQKKEFRDCSPRCVVAGFSDTPLEVLSDLADDVHPNVRAVVARNPNSSEEILDKLSDDDIWWIRKIVAENSNVSIQTLKKLINDSKEEVSAAAQEHLPIQLSDSDIQYIEDDFYDFQ